MTRRTALGVAAVLLGSGLVSAADASPAATGLPSVGPSLIRLLGAFALVIVVGFGLLWLFRRGVRFNPRGSTADRKLNLLEARVLGNRQSLLVVGYNEQRMLLASTPAGISFLTHLPPAEKGEEPELQPNRALIPSFAEALQHALGRRA